MDGKFIVPGYSSVEHRVLHFLDIAEHHYGMTFDCPTIVVRRMGTRGGTYHHNKNLLTFNIDLMRENPEHYWNDTIPHEVAHLVVNWQARKQRQRPRPHGPEWQLVMQSCYGLQALRCHSYQTRPARCIPRNFLYRCHCREHRLTSIMHKKLSKHYQALCKSCRTQLKFVAELGR